MEFELAPAGSGTTLVLGVIATSLVALVALSVWITWTASHGAVALTERGMQLGVPIYGRTIPLSHLDLEHAKVASLEADPGLRPKLPDALLKQLHTAQG